MECNKDEAERAKEIAEHRLSQNDVAGANKFALKAQKLYPELDGLSQFISILEVLIKGESSVANEKDWYAIMSLSPSADETMVRKQYRRLVLQFHPDKNKSKGADNAFKLIQQAFDVLKDKDKRQVFDEKRRTHAVNGHRKGNAGNKNKCASDSHFKFQARGNPQKATQPAAQPSPSTAGCREQGAPQTAARPARQPPKPKNATCTGDHPSQKAARTKLKTSEQPIPQPSQVFWTRCTSCRMWFQYSLIYYKCRLLCRNCLQPFYAAKAGHPVVGFRFEEMQGWKHANLVSANGSNGSGISNQGSSDNVTDAYGNQYKGQPCKRMRGEGSINANGTSS